MNELKNFFEDESGIGVVEIVLILIVLVALVVLFKGQVSNIMGEVFDKVSTLVETL